MPPAAASPPTTQPDPQPSRAGRLLSLVRKLIDYGKELVATVRQRVASDPIFARTGFGTTDIALILTRIARGLHRAQALEDRVTRCAALLDAGPRRARGQSKARPSAARPLTAPPDPRLAGLPTAEQIAAEVRRRPIGAVIADICRDLGILPSLTFAPRLCSCFVHVRGPPPIRLTSPTPGPQPSRSGRLLSLVRKLIEYGKELAATIRRRAVTDPTSIRICFGTTDIALILATHQSRPAARQ